MFFVRPFFVLRCVLDGILLLRYLSGLFTGQGSFKLSRVGSGLVNRPKNSRGSGLGGSGQEGSKSAGRVGSGQEVFKI